MRKVQLIAMPWFGLLCLFTSGLSQSAQLPLHIDTPQWQLVLGRSVTDGDSHAFTVSERALVRELEPLIAEQNYVVAAEVFTQHGFESAEVEDQDWRLLRLFGQVLMALEDYSAAQNVLEAALAQEPEDPTTLQNLVTIYLRVDAFARAQAMLVRSIESGQRNAQLFAQLGFIHIRSDRPQAAIAAYQQALMLAPEQSAWQRGLLFAFVQARATEQAQPLLDELLARYPNDVQLWLQRAQLALDRGDKRVALASLESAFTLGHGNWQSMLQAAQLHVQGGSAARAAALIAQLPDEQLAEAQVFERVVQIASLLLQQRIMPPLDRLVDALHDAPLTASQRAQRDLIAAEIAWADDDKETALQLLSRAEQADPSNGRVVLRLAQLLITQDQVMRAQLVLQRALVLDDVALQAHVEVAQLAIEAQDYASALMHLRRVDQLQPNQPNVRQNIRSLERLLEQS